MSEQPAQGICFSTPMDTPLPLRIVQSSNAILTVSKEGKVLGPDGQTEATKEQMADALRMLAGVSHGAN